MEPIVSGTAAIAALAFHSLIPEHVPVVTSVTTTRPRLLKTEAGTYQFRHLHPHRLSLHQAGDPGYVSRRLPGPPGKGIARPDPPIRGPMISPSCASLQNLEFALNSKRLHEIARRKPA